MQMKNIQSQLVNEKAVRLFENASNCVVNVFMIINVKSVGLFKYCIMLTNGVWYVTTSRSMTKDFESLCEGISHKISSLKKAVFIIT